MTLLANYGPLELDTAKRLEHLGLIVDCGDYFAPAIDIPMHIIENTI